MLVEFCALSGENNKKTWQYEIKMINPKAPECSLQRGARKNEFVSKL